MASEYRVIWERDGCRVKRKRYASRKAAERFMRLLGPEPWVALGKDPNALVCCRGTLCDQNQCGCGGLTWREHLEAQREDIPALKSVRLETRTVGPWTAVPTDGTGEA